MKFTELNLSPGTLKALEKKGYEKASPIQAQCIPLLLESDNDVIGQAQTGTGKTAAFGIPIIERIDTRSRHVQALILTPTRELAIQVAEEISSFKGRKRINIALLYGGASVRSQIERLRAGAHIVVGTAGRVQDMINKKQLRIDNLKYFILDEADEMLNMGFLEDIENILKSTNDDKQMLFFSATMPPAILQIAKRYMKPGFQIVKVKAQQLTTKNTEQLYFEVRERDKVEALTRIIDASEDFYGIIFCRTKRECDNLASTLQNRGYMTDALHGDVEQRNRERILKRFKSRKTKILVATDVAARGIDVNDLTHVVNFHIPQDPESYTHRVGRTGRAGKKGIAITLITPSEWRKMVYIQRITKTDINKGDIPSIDKVIEAKKKNIKAKINTMSKANFEKYEEMTQNLLEEYDPKVLVSSLLKIAFSDQIEADSYKEIEDITRNRIDRTGNAKLFIARGRSHGFGKREIAEMLKKEAGLRDQDIKDIYVLDEFSFVTLPFVEAEVVLQVFNKKGGRSIVSRARERKSSHTSSGNYKRGQRPKNRRR